jgi:hypothetical protein
MEKIEEVVHLEGLFLAWGEVVLLFEVDIGDKNAKEYSLSCFEVPQALFKWNIILGANSTLLEA